jgi:hypothetical protein
MVKKTLQATVERPFCDVTTFQVAVQRLTLNNQAVHVTLQILYDRHYLNKLGFRVPPDITSFNPSNFWCNIERIHLLEKQQRSGIFSCHTVAVMSAADLAMDQLRLITDMLQQVSPGQQEAAQQYSRTSRSNSRCWTRQQSCPPVHARLQT